MILLKTNKQKVAFLFLLELHFHSFTRLYLISNGKPAKNRKLASSVNNPGKANEDDRKKRTRDLEASHPPWNEISFFYKMNQETRPKKEAKKGEESSNNKQK